MTPEQLHKTLQRVREAGGIEKIPDAEIVTESPANLNVSPTTESSERRDVQASGGSSAAAGFTKGFDGLSAIQKTVEANFQNKLIAQRRQLYAEFLKQQNVYEQNPENFAAVKAGIKPQIDRAMTLFSNPEISEEDIKEISAVLATVQKMIENPQAKMEVGNLAPEADINEPALAAPTPLILNKSDMVKSESEAIAAVPVPESIEQMKSSLTILDGQVNALYDTITIPLYNRLKAQGLTEHPEVKKMYGKDGKLGSLISAFSICALAKARFVEKLNETSNTEPSPELMTLYKKFNKQVTVLEHRVQRDTTNLEMLLAASVIPPEAEVTEPEGVSVEPLKPLVLNSDARVLEEPLKPLVLNEVEHRVLEEPVQPTVLVEPEQSINMSVTSGENLAEQLPTNIISIADKYKAERESIGAIVKELLTKDNLPDHVQQSLSFVQNEMLTRLGVLSYTDPQYISLRERIKEVVNAAQQLSGEEVTVAQAPAVVGQFRGQEVTVAQAPALGGQLRGEEDALSSAPALEGQLRGEAAAVTSVSAIEVGANRYLAPKIRKKLQANPKLIAALFLAVVSVTDVNEISKHTEPLQSASFDTESPLSRMGKNALWDGDEATKILPNYVQIEPEKIVIVRPNNGEEESPLVTPEATTNTRIANMNFATKGETLPVVTTEAGALPTVDLSEDNLPKVSEVVVNRFGYEPTALEVNTEVTETSTMDTSVPEPAAPPVAELDPKSPAYQESIAPTESVASGNSVVEVLAGNEATFPDRAINPLLAAVDAAGIPEVLANKLRAEEKEAFLSDSNRLKAAGVGSGQRGSTFPGEKINYSDPVERLNKRFDKTRQELNVPHTEVAESGDTRTSLALESYARDLKLIPAADHLNLVSAAVEAYYATPAGRETLNGEDKDTLKPGAVVPLQGVAPFLAAEIANYVRKTVAADNIESSIGTVVETEDVSGSASEVLVDNSPAIENISYGDTESGSASEVITDGVISPENYPGGILEYSKAYNEKLESLGIATKVSSTFDSWFQPRTADTYDNRELLKIRVGELTQIMMQDPLEIVRELELRKISYESANALYKLIIEARAAGQVKYDIKSPLTGEEVIKDRVLAEAPKISN